MRRLRVTTWNVNGIRAAARKGLVERIDGLKTDVLLLQEVRATPDQLDLGLLAELESRFEHIVWHPAEKLGYSGVALLSRVEPAEIRFGLDQRKRRGAHDDEGRVIVARFELERGPVRVMNIYMPSGSSGEHRQAIKDVWLERTEPLFRSLARSPIATLVCGDINTAHDERDIFHAKSNRNSSGFLPHERAWYGRLLEQGWRDTLRESAGDVPGPYTWWSMRGQAMKLDRGWRIDHVFANARAATLVESTVVDREAAIGCSDHAPVTTTVRMA
ncbi:MAG: exodeoxyribonuclease III [Planctomycetota bacterium]